MSIRDRLQAAAIRISAGPGEYPVRVLLHVCLALFVLGLYSFSRFRGLSDADAMDAAQIGANLAEGRGFSTFCLRPADFRFIPPRAGEDSSARPVPEIRRAPLYPWLLSAGFRIVRPAFEVSRAGRLFFPEIQVVVPLGVLLSAGTVVLLYLMGRMLFGQAAGAAASMAYLVTGSVLSDATGGTAVPLMAFLCTGSVYASLVAAARRREGRPARSWLIPLALSALLCGLAMLSAYGLVVLLPALLVFWSMSEEPMRGRVLMIVLAVSLAIFLPWIARNVNVSGRPFGAAPYAALNETAAYPHDTYDRDLSPGLTAARAVRLLKWKFARNFARAYDGDLRTLGSGLAVCLFLASLLVRLDGDDSRNMRWGVVTGLALLVGLTALSGPAGTAGLRAFLPLVVVYGVGFAFLAVAEKVQLPEELWHPLLTWGLLAATALPMLLTVFGTLPRSPYPPYFPPFSQYVSGLLTEDETLCTDIPWATAWYGRRRSVLLPRSVDQFERIHLEHEPIRALYLTSRTGDQPYGSSLRTGAERSWLPLLNGNIPENFPLRHLFTLPPGRTDQVILTDRVRGD